MTRRESKYKAVMIAGMLACLTTIEVSGNSNIATCSPVKAMKVLTKPSVTKTEVRYGDVTLITFRHTYIGEDCVLKSTTKGKHKTVVIYIHK